MEINEDFQLRSIVRESVSGSPSLPLPLLLAPFQEEFLQEPIVQLSLPLFHHEATSEGLAAFLVSLETQYGGEKTVAEAKARVSALITAIPGKEGAPANPEAERLWAASFRGDLGGASEMALRQPLLVNWRDPEGQRSSLFIAASKGLEVLVGFFLMLPLADPNLVDLDGRSPLFAACQRGFAGVVRLLLADERVQVNTQNRLGMTALAVASQAGHAEVVQLLLGHKNVDERLADSQGRTPEDLASLEGHTAVVRLFLQSPKGKSSLCALGPGLTSFSKKAAMTSQLTGMMKDVGLKALPKGVLGLIPKGGQSKAGMAQESLLKLCAMSPKLSAVVEKLKEKGDQVLGTWTKLFSGHLACDTGTVLCDQGINQTLRGLSYIFQDGAPQDHDRLHGELMDKDFDIEETEYITTESAMWEKFQAGKERGKGKRIDLQSNDILCLNLYSREEPPFYKQLNGALRDSVSRDPRKRLAASRTLFSWKYFSYHLARATVGLPGHTGRLYRGQRYLFGEESIYAEGNLVMWPSFTSASVYEEVALSFLEEGGVVFEIDLDEEYGCYVGDYSVFPSEFEVLLPPFTSFLIKSKVMDGNICRVGLKCQGLPLFLRDLGSKSESPRPERKKKPERSPEDERETGVRKAFKAAKDGKVSFFQDGHLHAGHVNARNEKGQHLVYVAARHGKVDVVSWLLDNGAEINCQDPNGYTPLHGAALKNHKEVGRLLIKRGASLTIKNVMDKTVMDDRPKYIAEVVKDVGSESGILGRFLAAKS